MAYRPGNNPDRKASHHRDPPVDDEEHAAAMEQNEEAEGEPSDEIPHEVPPADVGPGGAYEAGKALRCTRENPKDVYIDACSVEDLHKHQEDRVSRKDEELLCPLDGEREGDASADASRPQGSIPILTPALPHHHHSALQSPSKGSYRFPRHPVTSVFRPYGQSPHSPERTQSTVSGSQSSTKWGEGVRRGEGRAARPTGLAQKGLQYSRICAMHPSGAGPPTPAAALIAAQPPTLTAAGWGRRGRGVSCERTRKTQDSKTALRAGLPRPVPRAANRPWSLIPAKRAGTTWTEGRRVAESLQSKND